MCSCFGRHEATYLGHCDGRTPDGCHSLRSCTILQCRRHQTVRSILHSHICYLCIGLGKGKANASSYISQYPVIRTAQSAVQFTSLSDLFTQTPSRLLWEASSHMLQLMREGCSYTYPPLSIARYSFIQLSELEQCRVKKLAQGFNTATRIRTRALSLSHCALRMYYVA